MDTHPRAFCLSAKSQWELGSPTHHRPGLGAAQLPGSLSPSRLSQMLGALWERRQVSALFSALQLLPLFNILLLMEAAVALSTGGSRSHR